MPVATFRVNLLTLPSHRHERSRRISSVWYRQILAANSSLDLSGVHEVELSVALGLDGGDLVEVTWARDDRVEGITVSRIGELYGLPEDPWVPMADQPQWRERIAARRMAGIGFGWQVNEGGTRSAWSIQLDFDGSASVVIALGELRGHEIPRYHPDTLVVIFSDDLARSYGEINCQRTRSFPCGRTGAVPAGGQFISLSAVS